MSNATSELIVSVSGIRGIVGESLTPVQATLFATALGTYLGSGRVVVSCDSRPSGDALRHAVIAGLLAAGCSVEEIGIAPTPTVGIAVTHLGAVGAIQITASHNPAPWNGLKMFGSDGAVLSAERGKKVQQIFEQQTFRYAKWDGMGRVGVPPESGEEHLRLVCDAVSVSRIATSGLRVFIDGNGGAGGPLAVQLLHRLGCEVVEQGCTADGIFVHQPEPIPEHLEDVGPSVKDSGSHIGFALDPDADRLVLIDETGQCVSEEMTLALAVRQRLSEQRGPVVVNMSTSRMVEDVCQQYHCECLRSAVGEANVVSSMRNVKAIIGGEGNGGVIDPRIGWVRDPFIGMAQILTLMSETKLPLSELVASMAIYSMLKTKFTVPKEKLPQLYATLETRFPEAKANRLDGLRLDWPDRWLHVRPSNTEPVVRAIAESPTRQATKLLFEAVEESL